MMKPPETAMIKALSHKGGIPCRDKSSWPNRSHSPRPGKRANASRGSRHPDAPYSGTAYESRAANAAAMPPGKSEGRQARCACQHDRCSQYRKFFHSHVKGIDSESFF